MSNNNWGQDKSLAKANRARSMIEPSRNASSIAYNNVRTNEGSIDVLIKDDGTSREHGK